MNFSKFIFEQEAKENLIKDITTSVEFIFDQYGPKWAEPYIDLDSSGDHIYVSLTEDLNESRLIKWSELIKNATKTIEDKKAIKKHIINAKKLIEVLESSL